MLTPTPILGASTRFRVQQFRPALTAAGIDSELSPFLDEEGLGLLYRRGAELDKFRTALRALGRRVRDLVHATRADGVFIHREAALVGPPIVEWLVTKVLQRPLIFDLDDAVWEPYTSPTYGKFLSRALKVPSKTNFTLGVARQVIAGSPYLAGHCRRLNPRVELIPTVVDTDRFCPATRTNLVPVLGWIGTHSTVPYLASIVPALRRVARNHRFIVRVVGGRLHAPGLEVDEHPWSLEREISDFQSLDIGLYPVVLDPWSIGKSGFKAVQYMACAVPIVASPVGVTQDMIRDGGNGFLADCEDQWVERLSVLLQDEGLRRRMGQAGRVDAVEKWSTKVHAPRFVQLISQAISP
jgi:glycosyltransferase involved in cell wall biosynthesis